MKNYQPAGFYFLIYTEQYYLAPLKLRPNGTIQIYYYYPNFVWL